LKKTILVLLILAFTLSGCTQSSGPEGTTETYNAGDTITELIGAGEYAGQEMTVKVVKIDSLNSATFQLYDETEKLIRTLTIGPGKGDINFTMKELGTMVYVTNYGKDFVEVTINR